jgi:hypothetical protein
VHEVPAEHVRDLDLDLVIYQTPRQYFEDRYEILSPRQQHLPAIYLEHNTPKPYAERTPHPVDDRNTLLVHVTHYNRLMWDNRQTPNIVIEHSVCIDPTARYEGELARGITVVNGPHKRPRISGFDLFLDARDRHGIPLDLAGMETEAFGGFGDIPYRHLHHRMARYRFYFSPMRYTSLPLALVEALTVGMPVVALATTEVPGVLRDGEHGFVSCDFDYLLERMRELLMQPQLARELGQNARRLAEQRFGLQRFIEQWDQAFALAMNGRTQPQLQEVRAG